MVTSYAAADVGSHHPLADDDFALDRASAQKQTKFVFVHCSDV